MSLLPSLSSFLNGAYPPAAFHFKVIFSVTGAGGMMDSSFQEVSGLTSEWEVEEIKEGGQNLYIHKLPTGQKKGTLVLKRGIAALTSPLVVWCKAAFEANLITPITPQPIIIQLLDENGSPLRMWNVMNAWPVKWEVDSFGSTKNEVAIETIELAYTYSNRLM